MKLEKNIVTLLDSQINKKLYSAYLYLYISEYYSSLGYTGFAHWFKKQASEEEEHALKIYDYLVDAGERVTFKAIEGINKEFTSLKDPLVLQLEHEEYVTASIHTIVEEARKVNDFRTEAFLTWFVNEQAEEEKNARDLLSEFELIENCKGAIYQLNTKLGSR